MRRRVLAVLAGLAVGLPACATGPPAPAPVGWDLQAKPQQAEPTAGLEGVLEEVPGDVTFQSSTEFTQGELSIRMSEFWFDPTIVTAPGGATITLKLENEGGAVHTFTSEQLGVDVTVTSGDQTHAEVTLPADGVVRYYCAFHELEGMVGAFSVGASRGRAGEGRAGG